MLAHHQDLAVSRHSDADRLLFAEAAAWTLDVGDGAHVAEAGRLTDSALLVHGRALVGQNIDAVERDRVYYSQRLASRAIRPISAFHSAWPAGSPGGLEPADRLMT